jgi:hypothetical protein
MMMPWLLIALGLIFLLENLNIIPSLNWSIIWPIILILAGLFMMKKRCGHGDGHGHGCCGWHDDKKMEDKK